MSVLRAIVSSEQALKRFARAQLQNRRLKRYLASDRRPWSHGYDEYKSRFIENAVRDETLLRSLRLGRPLPDEYGFRLDERCIEIPWALARIGNDAGRMLDAGSSLNHEFALGAPALAAKKLTIVTLAPEGAAYWTRGISYVYGDLRSLEFRDDWFDGITCISTIEHVGMDNALYSNQPDIARPGDTKDFAQAVRELKRVLKPGSDLYITFPFGRYENHGFFQQFDAALTDVLIEAFAPSGVNESIFQYAPDGWKLSSRSACMECEYFNVHKSKYFDATSNVEYAADYAAGVRAVACLELRK